MKQAAAKKLSDLKIYFREKPAEGRDRTVGYHLYKVADVFIEAQFHRNEAYYNTGRTWELTEVLLQDR